MLDTSVDKDVGFGYIERRTHSDTRGRFFTLGTEQLDDKRLRKGGMHILEVSWAHGVLPPRILHNRLVCAWGSNLPEQVLIHFAHVREHGITLIPTACQLVCDLSYGAYMSAGGVLTANIFALLPPSKTLHGGGSLLALQNSVA
ncbi:unnamed protein product [Prorocentrum cordatum]|uniref:Uncharacterized protein n=1 Tax=Prorocentrum cordatum TaxID=2364126 RepID=A0ABN9QQP1_9DINO|nr:unnamed protein product [Polarella glacialis]